MHEVSVHYGHVMALQDLSFEIAPGEIIALVGPSGSGKTTALRVLGTAVRAQKGCVRIQDQPVSELSSKELRKLRAKIGFVHQDLRLVPNLRVVQNVLAGELGRLSYLSSLRSMLLPSKERIRRVYGLLDRVGIAEKIYQRTDELSGGQRQRVAIARVLYQDPIAILADEPVSSLDPSRSRDILRLLTDIAGEDKLTLVLSMHDLELAREFCPRLIGLREGRIMFDQATKDVPKETFDALYELNEREIIEDGS